MGERVLAARNVDEGELKLEKIRFIEVDVRRKAYSPPKRRQRNKFSHPFKNRPQKYFLFIT